MMKTPRVCAIFAFSRRENVFLNGTLVQNAAVLWSHDTYLLFVFLLRECFFLIWLTSFLIHSVAVRIMPFLHTIMAINHVDMPCILSVV